MKEITGLEELTPEQQEKAKRPDIWGYLQQGKPSKRLMSTP